MGFPHMSKEDIDYNGYLVPNGAYLLSAIWWFYHGPEVYSEPETFDPKTYPALMTIRIIYMLSTLGWHDLECDYAKKAGVINGSTYYELNV